MKYPEVREATIQFFFKPNWYQYLDLEYSPILLGHKEKSNEWEDGF